MEKKKGKFQIQIAFPFFEVMIILAPRPNSIAERKENKTKSHFSLGH